MTVQSISDSTGRELIENGNATFESITRFDSLGRRHAILVRHDLSCVAHVPVNDDNADYWESLPSPEYLSE